MNKTTTFATVVMENSKGQTAKAETLAETNDIPMAMEVPKSVLEATAERKAGARYLRGNTEELDRVRRANIEGVLSSVCCCLQVNSGMQGRFIVPMSVTVASVMSCSSLDLSYAEFVHPITTIKAASVCGCTRLKLPAGINVELKGNGVCGNIDLARDYTQPVPGAPTVFIKGSAVCAWAYISFATEAPPITVWSIFFFKAQNFERRLTCTDDARINLAQCKNR